MTDDIKEDQTWQANYYFRVKNTCNKKTKGI